MLDMTNTDLPDIPGKRYFTIGEVSDLCLVRPHVLRYWEQEFAQLKPVKRRGNRRYYQRHEVQLIRKIRSLVYADGFTISGARHQLESLEHDTPHVDKATKAVLDDLIKDLDVVSALLEM
ncbi:MAG: MerR family transcriptional regulator [Arenicellales bacterium WSBS_2016_MAG_OTU3]